MDETEKKIGFVASGARDNLRKTIEKFPALVMECLDAAYVAGLDDATNSKNEALLEGIRYIKGKVRCAACDGANCEHTQRCTGFDDVLAYIAK